MEEKRITIYDIADKTGFSAATVHRALNNKGRISEKTKKLILETASELGYKVNPAAQGLRRSPIKIGAILYCPVDEYVDAIIDGISYCSEKLEKYNVSTEIVKIPYTESKECIKASCRLIKDFSNKNFDGIILFMSSTTDESTELLSLVKDLSEKNISFATVANDILGKDGVIHIGIDAYLAGKMAAEMLQFSCKNKDVALLTTSKTSPINIDYISGFMDYSSNNIFSSISIYEHFDNKDKVLKTTQQMLSENPELKGIYMTTASSTLACKSIKESGRTDISIITTDLLSETPDLLKEKIADATIFQNPFKQGKLVLNSLYNFIITKKHKKPDLLSPHIILSSNVDSYLFKSKSK